MSLRIAFPLFAGALLLLAGCGLNDDGYKCGPGQTLEIESAIYPLEQITGEFIQGPANEGSAQVDRESGSVTLSYINAETGAQVVETYQIRPVNEVETATSENPSDFPGR